MDNVLELVVIVVIAVAGFTFIYRALPFRVWNNKKPKFAFFPKYIATFNSSVSDIESNLIKLKFRKSDHHTYTRGKVYGDFSAKLIKLTVNIDETNNQIKVYASFFGVLFDTGDIWQVAADIIQVDIIQ